MKKRILLIIIPIIILVTYIIGIYLTKDRMIGNMKINGINCSFMNYEDVVSLLEENIEQPAISIMNGETELTKLDVSSYCKFSYDINIIKEINEEIPFYERLIFYAFNFEKNIQPEVSIDEEALNQVLIDSNGSTYPENAYIKYNNETGNYEIIPETQGDVIETEAATKIISEAISNNDYSVDISSSYIKAGVLEDNPELNEKLQELNNSFNFSITYQVGTEEIVVNKNVYFDWFEKDNNGVPLLDDNGNYAIKKDKIKEYVKDLANKYNTVGKPYEFKTHTEDIVEVTNGTYGYEVDEEKEISTLIENLTNKENVKREPVWLQKEMTTDGIMDTYIEVSIDEQHLWFYKNGNLTLETDVVTGTKNSNDTDKGVWYVYSKQKNRYLTGPTWKTWVDYWMPFNEGEGLHDASWRKKFGGNIYKSNGSHGCVNLPSDFAGKLYDEIEVGTPVIVY